MQLSKWVRPSVVSFQGKAAFADTLSSLEKFFARWSRNPPQPSAKVKHGGKAKQKVIVTSFMEDPDDIPWQSKTKPLLPTAASADFGGLSIFSSLKPRPSKVQKSAPLRAPAQSTVTMPSPLLSQSFSSISPSSAGPKPAPAKPPRAEKENRPQGSAAPPPAFIDTTALEGDNSSDCDDEYLIRLWRRKKKAQRKKKKRKYQHVVVID